MSRKLRKAVNRAMRERASRERSERLVRRTLNAVDRTNPDHLRAMLPKLMRRGRHRV